MITSESAFIQESFVLSWYRYFSLSRPMHGRPKENRAKQWNLIIMHTYHWFGNARDLTLPFQEHCWPLSALPGDVTRSVSLWWSTRPHSSEHLRAAVVCLSPYSLCHSCSTCRVLFIFHLNPKWLYTNNVCILPCKPYFLTAQSLQ